MIHTFIFLLGAMAGATVGVIIMAMLTIAKRADKDELRALGGLPEAGHWKVAPSPADASDGSKESPGNSKRCLNALTMAGSHGSVEAVNSSATSIKSVSQTVLGSALGTVRPIKIPISASDTRVESMTTKMLMLKMTPAAAATRSSGKNAAIPET